MTPELVRRIETALAGGNATTTPGALLEALQPGRPGRRARASPTPSATRWSALLTRDLDPETLTDLDDEVRDDVLDQLGRRRSPRPRANLETDDAVDLLEDLPDAERREVLAELPAEERAAIEKALAYPEDSAGRLMQRSWSRSRDTGLVGQTIDYLPHAKDLPDDFYDLFVVDRAAGWGSVPLSRCCAARGRCRCSTSSIPTSVGARRHRPGGGGVSVPRQVPGLGPVVDDAGRLLGVVMVDDVVDVIDEEAEEDLLEIGGVGDADIHANPCAPARLRGLWLVVNLFTTVIASLVIGQFEGTIGQFVSLAVLMPIVASMGGNAGTQTITVTVRALAMGELTAANALRFIAKEAAVGG